MPSPMFTLIGLVGCAVGATAQGIVIKPRQVLTETVGILSADLGAVGVEVPLCNGTVDLLPVTFTFPVVNEPMPEDFEVEIGTLEGNRRTTVSPRCATLAPANELNERRTVLLAGAFTPGNRGPIAISVVGNLSLDVNGDEQSATGSSIASPAGDFFSFSSGPRVVDFELVDLAAADAFNATADPNGCAAAFPNATYTLRLIFSAGVRQRAPGGGDGLEFLGANGTAESAAEFFSLSAFAVANGSDGEPEVVRDVLLGIADVDPDNVVDLCVESAAPLSGVDGRQTQLRVNCGGPRALLGLTADEGGDDDGAGVIFDPAGDACRRQNVLLASASGGPVSFTFASEGASARTSESGEGVSSSASAAANSDDASGGSAASASSGEDGRASTSAASRATVL